MQPFDSHSHHHLIMCPNCWKSLISIILSFQERYKIGIIHCVTLGIAFFSLSIIPSRFIKAVVCINSSLLHIAELYSMAWMYHCWFNDSAAKGHLGCFWVFAVTVKLLRIFIYKCLCEHELFFFFFFSRINAQEFNCWVMVIAWFLV